MRSQHDPRRGSNVGVAEQGLPESTRVAFGVRALWGVRCDRTHCPPCERRRRGAVGACGGKCGGMCGGMGGGMGGGMVHKGLQPEMHHGTPAASSTDHCSPRTSAYCSLLPSAQYYLMLTTTCYEPEFASRQSTVGRSAAALTNICIGSWCVRALMVHWCIGALVHWCIGALVHWCNGAFVHLCICAFVHLCICAFVHLCICAFVFVHLCIGAGRCIAWALLHMTLAPWD